MKFKYLSILILLALLFLQNSSMYPTSSKSIHKKNSTRLVSKKSFINKNYTTIREEDDFIHKLLKNNTQKNLNVTHTRKPYKKINKNRSQNTKENLETDINENIDNYLNENEDEIFNPKKSENKSSINTYDSKYPVYVYLTTSKPKQGETISVYVRSSKPILKCFANIGGERITFVHVKNNREFRGFIGFDIQYPTDDVKLLIAVLFKDNKIKYIEKKLSVQKKVITQAIRIFVYKKKWVLQRYWFRGKLYSRWVMVRYRVAKYIKPPEIPTPVTQKTLNEFKNELNRLLESYRGYQSPMGEGDNSSAIYEHTKENNKIHNLNKGEREHFISRFKISTPQQFWSGSFLQPTYPKDSFRISKFGSYRVFFYGGTLLSGYHRGLDIARPYGSHLYAPNHGIVVIAGRYQYRGNAVVIDHGGGVYSVHYHLSKIIVKKGMFVRKGQYIGNVGSTGISTGPHLHWEIRVHGTSVDPLQWKMIR